MGGFVNVLGLVVLCLISTFQDWCHFTSRGVHWVSKRDTFWSVVAQHFAERWEVGSMDRFGSQIDYTTGPELWEARIHRGSRHASSVQ